jgi:hypothetical protein
VKKNKSKTSPAAAADRWIVLSAILSVTFIVVVTLLVSGPVAVIPVLAASGHAWTKLCRTVQIGHARHKAGSGMR